MEVLRDFAPLIRKKERDFAHSDPLPGPSALAPGPFVPAAAASTRRVLLSGLSTSKRLPPLTVRLLHGRLLRLDLLGHLSYFLLHALSNSGLHLYALSLHSLFPNPSHLTLPFALKSASRLPNSLHVGEQLHARSLKLPSHSDPYVLTSFLNLYAKCGLLDHARAVFDEMRCPHTVSWAALIAAYMNAGRDKEAVATARDAFASGMRPDDFTAVQVLKACARVVDLDTGEAVWRMAVREGIATNLSVVTAAVNLYIKCGEMAKARKVFDKMPHKDAMACGAMEVLRDFEPRDPASTLASTHRVLLSSTNPLPPLTARLLHGRLLRLDLLHDLFHLLLRALSSSGLHLHALCLHSLFPNLRSHLTLPFALKSASRLPNALPVGEQLHARSLKLPSHSNPHVLTSLLNLYAKCGLLDQARAVFDEMRCPDTASWNALIAAYVDAERYKEAVATARDAFARGMRPDDFTAVQVLSACARVMDLDTGEAVWRMAEREGIATDLFVATAAVNLYTKCGEMAKAREVFEMMPKKDAVAWRAMVKGYASNMYPREALELIFAMQTQGVRPDCDTVAAALSACTRLGRLDNPVLGAALIDMFVKHGSAWDALLVFQQMRERDIFLWNKMILGLGMTGHGKIAFSLVGQMEKSGIKLNDNTFIGILCSCTHTGLVKDGRRYFHHMTQLYDITPQIEHYGCMVDLLSRAGLLQEAHQLINDMPMQANAVVWGTLLGGCKIHRDVELAEHVLKQLILLEPQNLGNYVMLLNIYSNSDRREDAAKLRLGMQAKQVKKVRASSCVEFGGKVHEFHVGHKSHPLTDQIFKKLDELGMEMKTMGYKPTTDVVMFDVEDEEGHTDSPQRRSVVMAAAPESASTSPAPNVSGSGGGIRFENCDFKSRLYEYVQKAGLMTPKYQFLIEGPPHKPIFRCTVLINNVMYESLPGFFSWKAAQQSAAEAALMEIGKSVALPSNHETGLCRSLLEQYAGKMNYAIPSYICNKQASGVGPFICTVEIGGIKYIGATAHTKKEAELKAAQTALLAIQGQSEGCANGNTKYIVAPGKRQVKETEKKAIETPKPLKAKNGGFKNQWNQKKFIKKNDEAVDVERDEARVPGETHHTDVHMKPAETIQDPSIDTVMLQPDEGDGRVKHEPTSDTAILQSDGEGRKVEQESPSGVMHFGGRAPWRSAFEKFKILILKIQKIGKNF